MLTGSLDSSAHAEAVSRSGPAIRLLHDSNRCAANGLCAWGIQGRSGRTDCSSGCLHTAIPEMCCGPRCYLSQKLGSSFCLSASVALKALTVRSGKEYPKIAKFAVIFVSGEGMQSRGLESETMFC